MYERCPRCGIDLTEKGRFCPRCGVALDPSAVRASPPPPPTSPQYPKYEPYYEKPQQTFSVVAFGLALGGLILWVLVIPAFVLGIIGLKNEPAGKTYAKVAIWISSIIMGFWALLIIAAFIIPLVLNNYYGSPGQV